MRNHRFSPRAWGLVLSPILALVMLAFAASGAFAHDVQSISGTVDCAGNYSITVHGDVFGSVHLIVKLDGNVISDAVTGQAANDNSFNDYGPFIGTGGSAGQAIFAKSSDESDANGSSGSLVLTQESCETPAPSETPAPTETPAPSDTPAPSQSQAPSETPEPSIPNTAMPSNGAGMDGGTYLLILGGLFVVLGGAAILSSRRGR